MQILLAAVLLVYLASCGMSMAQFDSGPTSNDLLEGRVAENTPDAPDDRIVVESAEDTQNIENTTAVSMEPYLFRS
jgi:hypothetical protein